MANFLCTNNQTLLLPGVSDAFFFFFLLVRGVENGGQVGVAHVQEHFFLCVALSPGCDLCAAVLFLALAHGRARRMHGCAVNAVDSPLLGKLHLILRNCKRLG